MTRSVFEYAVLRAVPRVERGECVNVGLVLYCQDADFLRTRVHLDVARLRALDAQVDVEGVRGALEALARTCAGEGPAGTTSLGQRFRWLTAPRSTLLQTSAVHCGLTRDPAGELSRLFALLVGERA